MLSLKQNPKLRLMPLPITMAVITVTPTDTVDITDMVVTDITVTLTDMAVITDITSAKDQLMPKPMPHLKPTPPHITELISVDITDTPMAVITVTDTPIITTP